MNRQTYEEAVDFLVELDIEATAGTRRKLDAWLRRSPENIRAYLQAVTAWEDSAGLTKVPVAQLLEQVAREDNVTALNATAAGPSAGRRTGARRRSQRLVAAAAIAACAVLAFVGISYLTTPTYGTRSGELFTLQLKDGSAVHLNARSKIRLHFSQRERRIDLLRGQALFEVAADTSRPFVVRSSRTRVQALGTSFDVERQATGVTVTVVEGRVAVQGADRSSVVTAGQQVVATAASITAPKSTDVATVTAWTKRREMVFDDATLAEVVAEFNRVGRSRLQLDPELEHLSVTARFDSADPRSLISFLATLPGMRVREHAGGVAIEANP